MSAWVDIGKIEISEKEMRRIRESELKWHEKYRRDKCRYGNQCVHCCPICCEIFEYADDGITLMKIHIRFEPKEEKKGDEVP